MFLFQYFKYYGMATSVTRIRSNSAVIKTIIKYEIGEVKASNQNFILRGALSIQWLFTTLFYTLFASGVTKLCTAMGLLCAR